MGSETGWGSGGFFQLKGEIKSESIARNTAKTAGHKKTVCLDVDRIPFLTEQYLLTVIRSAAAKAVL
jgi:hypothetical protein